MKSDEPISRKGSTVSVHFRLNGAAWQVFFSMPFYEDQVPTAAAFVSQLLDAEISMDDAGVGRRVFTGSLMSLLLWRLEAAGLKPIELPAPAAIAPPADPEEAEPGCQT